MQQDHARRGFSISHQKVVLEIDFSGSLWGYTEITIIPLSQELRTIHLHSRQCAIHSVSVGGHAADFNHHDPLANIALSSSDDKPTDCHKHPELKRKLYSALQESDEGELSIVVPKQVTISRSASGFGFSGGSRTATPEPRAQAAEEFNPMVVKIAYSLRNPVDGFEFVLPTEKHPYRVPHAYTTPSSPDSARCWVPCIDNMWEKCTWEFEFVVPRYLEEPDSTLQDDEMDDLTPTVVVCSGELTEQVAHPYNSNKTIFLFSQLSLTSVQHIAFAAGPFHLHTIPVESAGEESSATQGQQPLMYAFCLPGHERFITPTTSTLRSAMSFYSNEFGSYPFGSYKLVFVDELPSQRFDASTLSFVTVDLLHGSDALEQALESRHVLSHALACQWAGINIQPKTWSDLWLVNGLALYITGLFIRKLLGNNEYRFRMKKDMERVLEWDSGSMPPICQPQINDPPTGQVLPFINLKAPLVLHMLDRRLGKSGASSLGLTRVLPKVFLSAISGEMHNNALSTHFFMRTCRKVSGVDLRTFAEQWIYGSGAPHFSVSASFNRKKMAVEILLKQECKAWEMYREHEVPRMLMKPVELFEGQMTIRIHEADGTPYEHVLDIRSAFKRYEVPFNTKYKRVRRNTKRYLARQAAAQAAAEGDAEAAEAMGMVDMGFGLEIWEKEKERENWKVADWTEEDEGVMSGATYEWIRMDADFEWIAGLKFEQPDFMWVSQLQRDRDVVAQLEAIHALAKQPTKIVSSQLTKTVLVSNYHYRIRCEAATALVQCAIARLDFLGLFHLFKLFLRYCYDPEDPNQDLFAHTYVPKPNDFSDISEYFVRKSLIDAISRVRFESDGRSPPIVRRFMNDQLRYNDNTANPFHDGFYICTIISALARATVPTVAPERGELQPTEVRTEFNDEDRAILSQSLEEVGRYRSMDRLIPSPHNIVTIAALEFYFVLTAAHLLPRSHPEKSSPSFLEIILSLTREGNYTGVRIAAFDCIFMMKWYPPQLMRYILATMANDPSRVIRRHVARNACHSLAILAQMGEMKTSMKDAESLLIEEDASHPEKAREAKKSEVDMLIKVLRKDKEVGKNEVFREFMMPIVLAPDVDHEVRWCLLKLVEVLVRGSEESVPTVTVRLPPPTPVAEAPSPLPSVKVPTKLPKAAAAKSGGPPVASPVITASKLKLSKLNNTSRAGTPKIATPRTPSIVLPGSPAPAAMPMPAKKPKGRPPKNPQNTGHPPKSQATGISVIDTRAAASVLAKLEKNKHAKWFLNPVDPVRDQAPDYFQIIKEPMDLSTMRAKLTGGLYRDRFAFQSDFRLMIANAKAYNMPGSSVHNDAIALETFFEKQWTVMNKTIESKTAAPKPQPPKVLPPVPTPTFSPPPTPIAPRPTIKIKVGSQSKAAEVTPEAPPKPKLQARKVRLPEEPAILSHEDAPPPPYEDDGSHDLLQEVLAIEREKEQGKIRHPSNHDGERAPAHESSKRKRSEDAADDDILALATPLKREKPSAPTPSSSRIAPKPIVPKTTTKPRKDKPTVSAPTSAPSAKGKEKEILPLQSKVGTSIDNTPANEKKCDAFLKTLTKLPEARIFSRPVDPVMDGCPSYYEEIKHPMDFGTMSQKLAQGDYNTMGDFRKDIELIFANCRQFNPSNTFPTQSADTVEKVYKKEWSKILDLKPADKKSLQILLKNLLLDPKSFIFREPVDPVLLGIPHYFEVIPRDTARDLRTIGEKLNADQYKTTEDFEADMALMIDNAHTFNGVDTEVGAMTTQFKELYEGSIAKLKAGPNKKRKDGEKSNPQPTKKMKYV